MNKYPEFGFIEQEGLKRCRKCWVVWPIGNYSKRNGKCRARCRGCENSSRRKRQKDDLHARLAQSVRTRVYSCLKNAVAGRDNQSHELLGCSYVEYKVYLESKFVEGMTWENWDFYGWHIDHIKPISEFDLTDPEECKKAFHYTNTQPLWAQENFSKPRNRRRKKPIGVLPVP